MFEYLKFNLCEYIFVEVQNKKGVLSGQYKTSDDIIFNTSDTDWLPLDISAVQNPQLWIRRIEDLLIYHWALSYVAPFSMDGTLWEIRYKESGKLPGIIKGSNMFPNEWTALMMLLDELGTGIQFQRFSKPVYHSKHPF